MSDNVPFDKVCLQTIKTEILILQAGNSQLLGHQIAHVTARTTKTWPHGSPEIVK